jgi:hypothetical protein
MVKVMYKSPLDRLRILQHHILYFYNLPIFYSCRNSKSNIFAIKGPFVGSINLF